ncbi:MAG TPA: DUF3971 domain-containing protein [Rhizomicrobium sp.]|nr:DUF3971 domain-containing protein [Rhizomicrobium sp.]
MSLGPLGSALPNAIAQALPGITLQYDQAAIEWSRDEGRVNLVILGARVFDEDGRIIAQAPKADIDLAAGPLLSGHAVVQRITLVGVQLTLVRTESGGLRLGVEKDKSQHDILSRISDAITMRNDGSSSLQAFAVRHARLAFYDEPTGLFLVAPDANFRVTTVGADLDASLDAALEISGHSAHLTGEFAIPAKSGPVKGSIALRGLDLRALGSDGKSFASVKDVGLVLDMSMSFAFQGTHLLNADFGVGAKGAIDIPGLAHGPLKISNAQIVGRYDSRTGRILIDDATLAAQGATAHLTARGDLVYDQNRALSAVNFETTLDKIALSMPGVLPGPVSLRIAAVRGSYLLATKDILLDHMEIAGGPLSLQATAKVTLVSGKSPAIEAKGQLSPLGIRDLLKFWPYGVGAGARTWIDKNMPAGSLGPVPFEAHMPAGLLDEAALPDGALKVSVPMSGAEANYLQGLTHLTQLRGVATLTGNTFSADIASGRIGALAVSQGKVVISNLSVPASPGAFAAHVSGSMPDILNLIDMKPLNYPTRFGIDKTQTKGEASLDLSFQMPMKKDLHVDDVNISIKSAVNGFSILLGDHARLSDGTVNFAITNAKLHADGTATLIDSKLSFGWDEDFRTPNAVTTHIDVKGTLDTGGREALNFPSSDFLKGPTTIDAALTGHRGSLLNADMTMDLAPATLNLDLIGLNKPAGFPASARVTASFGPESSIKAESMLISGPGVSVSGNATFDKDGHLTLLAFPSVHFGAANDFSFNMTRGASGANITVRGRSLDGTHLAGHGGGGGDMSFEGPFHVSAHLDRLMLRENIAVAPFSLEVGGVGDRPSAMSLSGSLSKTATIAGEIAPSDTGRKITVSSTDAGLLTKGFLGFSSIKGGRFDLTATLPGKAGGAKDSNAPDYEGKLSLRDFKVLNQPFLTRLFTAGSLGGLINLMQGQGIGVDKLDVPFSSKGGVITVHDAKATGPAIGLTADGYIDRPKNALALKGTLVPVFGLNSVLGSIPVLGNVLVSKPGEGVFGMTYSVKGNADQPDLSINPLSVLTPGILRRIFEGKMPNAAQAPSNQTPPPQPAPASPPQ